jgi:hypothetical protein
LGELPLKLPSLLFSFVRVHLPASES